MEYVYIISNVLLIITAILIKKKSEKMNILISLLMTIILYFCYNTFCAYILNIMHLPINLISMTITNIIAITILCMVEKIVNKKIEFQKYYINKGELIFWIILILINIPILYQEFGMANNFRFISTDATMHAAVAKKFSETQALVTSLDGNVAVNPTFLIGGYVNLGMLFQTFNGILGEFDIYKLYIIFDSTVYILTGLVFYYILKKYTKGKKIETIIAGILAIIYMLGYPLNSLITGFQYFSLGILQCLSIIYVLWEYGKNKVLPAIFLLNVGILLTYNLLAPVAYIIEIIVITTYHKKETGKIINKKLMKAIIIGMLIPGIIGVMFFVVPRIFGNIILKDAQNLNVDGYIYINYYTNILPFLPFAIYGIYKQLKEKKYTIGMIALLVMATYTSIFLMGKTLGQISTYYYMKNYYILMAFIILGAFQGICYIIEKGKKGKIIISSLLGVYIVVMTYNIIFVNVGAYDFTKTPDTSSMDIYNSNKAVMKYVQSLFPVGRIEALKYVNDNKCINGQNILLISNHIDEHLLQLFFNYQNRKCLDLSNIKEEIEEWNKGNYEYLIIFQKEKYLSRYKEIQTTENIVFEKGDVVIYSKKSNLK